MTNDTVEIILDTDARSLVQSEFDQGEALADKILQEMDADGYFSDPDETPFDVAHWNKESRRRKASVWASRDFPKEKVPAWFMNDYKRYAQDLKQKIFGAQRVMIE